MKNPYLKLCLMFLLCCTANLSMNAQSEEPDWNLLSEQSGVKIYLQVSTVNQINYINIKLVNTTANSIEFDWTLSKNLSSIYNELKCEVAGNGNRFIDGSVLDLSKSEQDLLSDYSITLNIK